MHWNLCGHENAIAFLQEHTKPQKMRQAYLITGPSGVGRKSLALAFIKAICCQNSPTPGQFCDECTTCRQIEARAFSDLTVIAAENGRDIKIEQIREMQKTLTLAPFQAPKRFVLIPNFQNASPGAANALLKSLEEPPPRAIILLTADAKESLLETISSRCEHIRLYPMTVSGASLALRTRFKMEEDLSEQLAHLTAGRIGASLRYRDDPLQLDSQHDILVELEDLLQKNYRGRLKYLEALLRQKLSPREQAARLIPVWLAFWRDCMIVSANAQLPLVYLGHREWLEQIAHKIPLAQIQKILLAHEKALEQLDSYANARLVLENLLLLPPRML
ncbi:MAG: DNA polymerase III subunit [Anaerolineaceae bacterium]|nr:DNA polymerase III subunit [Anaerolineaceae bacterium]